MQCKFRNTLRFNSDDYLIEYSILSLNGITLFAADCFLPSNSKGYSIIITNKRPNVNF